MAQVAILFKLLLLARRSRCAFDLLRLRQPRFNAAQRMECVSSLRWLGPGVAGAQTTSGQMAHGTEATFSHVGTSKPAATGQSQTKVRSLEAALAALGPEESVAKAEVESALQRAKQGSRVTRLDPDTKVAVARERESSRSNGRFRGARGREFEDSIEASSEGRTGYASGCPDTRSGGFHRKSSQENCQDRRRESFRSHEFGRSREEVDRVEGPITDSTTAGQRIGSPPVVQHGVSITGSDRQYEGQCRAESQADLPSGRFCAPLRRRDVGMDAITPEGSASGGRFRTSPRSGKGLSIVDHCSGGVATDHPGTIFGSTVLNREQCEVIRVRCGMAGIRVGEAKNPGPRRRNFVSPDDGAVGGAVARDTDSDDAPLVFPEVSVDVVEALEHDLAATQWEAGASFSLPSMGPEFVSGTLGTPVSLSTGSPC